MPSTPCVIAIFALPLLITACATENNDRCLGDSSNAIAGGSLTLQSAVVPSDCLPPGSRSNEIPTP